MITLDGILQAPGSSGEDTSGGFTDGGWVAPHGDKTYKDALDKEMKQQADYLLGRTTFEIWEGYWPSHGDFWPGINLGTKYVLSNTRTDTDWDKTVFISSVADIEEIKKSEGPEIQVWGSSKLIPFLFKSDFVDELRLKIFPLTLGKGKALFGKGTIPASFNLTECTVTSKGVILANYRRLGKVKTGSVGG